ncbi:hypothetical protein OCU04_012557 [Sclerotinia nivalis]|uniref:Uncharacterized protein n=1 Tax=Sclerotinia nivalis TaxID=352851 RepID=A0A9X0DDD0_9HELO|nr:hypothetical protein OCU04_012557 [Sclerotinia nivalis]
MNNTKKMVTADSEPSSKNTGNQVASQSKDPGTPPRTPPNTRVISPPGAPRQRKVRPEAMWTPDEKPSTSRRAKIIPDSRLIASVAHREHARRSDSRSTSPHRRPLSSHRTRSPSNVHHRSRTFTEATFGPLLDNSGNHSVATRPSQPESHYEVGAGYFNMLPLPESAPSRKISEIISSELPDDQKVGKILRGSDANAMFHTEEGNSDEERDFWSGKL